MDVKIIDNHPHHCGYRMRLYTKDGPPGQGPWWVCGTCGERVDAVELADWWISQQTEYFE